MKRLLLLIVFLLVFGAIVTGVMVWRAAGSAPSWYAPPNPGHDHVVRRAEHVEYRLVEEMQKIRAVTDVWTLVLHEDQINAWLVARLPEWIAHDAELEWPDELGTPQVHITEADIQIALPVQWRGAEQVVVTSIVPRLTDEGLIIDRARFALGRVPIPEELSDRLLKALEDLTRQAAGPDAQDALVAWVQQGDTVDPITELADGRLVELMELKLAEGELHLLCNTRLPGR